MSNFYLVTQAFRLDLPARIASTARAVGGVGRTHLLIEVASMTAESQTHTDKKDKAFPFNILAQNELMWWPYQSLSKSLLRTHHNTLALLEVNRMLADEMRDIARREQDFVLNLSEKILNRRPDGDGKRAEILPPEAVDEIFETAITGIRQFGQAVADAQVRSIEAFPSCPRGRKSGGQPYPGGGRIE